MKTLDCGHEPSEHSSISTGYGTTPEGKKHCYDCCTQRDLEELKDRTKPFVGYVKLAGRQIVNWPGRVLMTILESRKVSGGGFHFGSVLFVKAKDAHGNIWSGRGPGDGMYIKLHPRKSA